MNIFVLDRDPRRAAALMMNKHVVKMVLESAQMLSTNIMVVNGLDRSEVPYKPTHQNHPSAVWARETMSNHEWLLDHSLGLCEEYTLRYSKVHKSQSVIEWAIDNPPRIEGTGLTPFYQAMSEDCKHPTDSTIAYKTYYKRHKLHLLGKNETLKFD